MTNPHPRRHLYDDLSPAAQRLARVPRIGRLIGSLPAERVRQLARDATEADVFWEVYTYDTVGGNTDCGVLGTGLNNKQARRMAWYKDTIPPPSVRHKQIQRACLLLGAIAFELLAKTDADGRPKPWWNGTQGNYNDFQEIIRADRYEVAVTDRNADFYEDWEALLAMDSHKLEHFIFSTDARDQQLRWTDITTMAFFAAHWATNYGTPDDLQMMDRWIVDEKGNRLSEFDEFWIFAAEMPVVDERRWLDIFGRCYTSPRELQGEHDWVQWHRRMLYHSFRQMEKRSKHTKQVITDWRQSYLDLKKGTPEQQRIIAEIEGGFRDISAGMCPYGADSSQGEPGVSRHVEAFRLHQWPVTNLMYELFDPSHCEDRWYGEKHPLASKQSREGEDYCPVVNVTWYDAWCFAAWCGYRLPTELEWEEACRAGSTTRWYFGNDESKLAEYAWYDQNSEDSTHPVGELAKNDNDLYDMHGNVWEWCQDWYAPGASNRVLRGGSWYDYGRRCRSAGRNRVSPGLRSHYYGFRLAAVPVGAKSGKQDSGGQAVVRSVAERNGGTTA